MRIEFVTDYQSHPAGQILDLAGGVADVLVRRGIARPAPIAETAPEPPAEVPEPPAEVPPPPPKPAQAPKSKKGK